jgi:endo-1,4-beta-xylanase
MIIESKFLFMRLTAVLLVMLVLISTELFGQNEPVVIEAESGTLGADYQVITSGGVTYIAPQTDFINTAYPGSESKVASFTINFADSGTYKLFARVRVGPGTYDDDSFFHGNGFDSKNITSDPDWITCNNLVAAGFMISTDVVEGPGDAPAEYWKWLSLSDFTGQDPPVTFRVEPGELTRTFEIGAREDGFDIDKIAFGREGIYYTVDNLDKGEAGSRYPPEEEPVGPPLAYGLDKFLGCCYGYASRRDFAGYWNQVTPENSGKWGWVEGTRDNMSWGNMDEAYLVAMDSGYVFKHHVLVWGAQQPGWVAALDSAEQRAELEEWFTAVAERYPGIDQVEVVNEPLHQPPDDAHEGQYIGALGGTGVTGWDWILEAFRMARAAFTDSTVLMINEYGIMNSTTNTDRYLEIIHLLQAEDTLIDAIGFQAHGFSHNASNETILRNIDTLASTGLPIYVTELDVDGLTDLQQVHGYMNLLPLFWEHPAIQGITLWGFRPGMWRTSQGAYLVDEYGVERPAMLWLRAYLKDEFVPNESVIISTSTSESSIETNDGTLQMLAEVLPDTSTLKTVYWTVSNNAVATIDQDGLLTAQSDGTVTVSAMSLELNSDVSDQMAITISGQVSDIETIACVGNIRIYPNPANEGTFTIEGLQDISSIVVLDMNGKQIIAHNVFNQTSINIHLNITTGLYILRLSDGSRVYHAKIAVK